MIDFIRKQYIGQFLQEFQAARDEVKKWSPEMQAEASKVGVLAFPRREDPRELVTTPRKKLD